MINENELTLSKMYEKQKKGYIIVVSSDCITYNAYNDSAISISNCIKEIKITKKGKTLFISFNRNTLYSYLSKLVKNNIKVCLIENKQNKKIDDSHTFYAGEKIIYEQKQGIIKKFLYGMAIIDINGEKIMACVEDLIKIKNK